MISSVLSRGFRGFPLTSLPFGGKWRCLLVYHKPVHPRSPNIPFYQPKTKSSAIQPPQTGQRYSQRPPHQPMQHPARVSTLHRLLLHMAAKLLGAGFSTFARAVSAHLQANLWRISASLALLSKLPTACPRSTHPPTLEYLMHSIQFLMGRSISVLRRDRILIIDHITNALDFLEKAQKEI